jgi:heme exporter protein A
LNAAFPRAAASIPATTPARAQPALQAVNLRCERGERALFADLNFALHPGAVLWLRGRNGRGKTSLLRTLAGLSEPAAGEIFWFGRAAGERSAAHRRALLHLGHANALKEDLTVAESLRFFSRLGGGGAGDFGPNDAGESPSGIPQTAAVQVALARVGLAGFAPRAIRTLSQGQRRRVALARLALGLAPAATSASARAPASLSATATATADATARSPSPASLWLLDEPFDALDDDGVARLAGLITEHAAGGGAVLFTSHLQVPALGPALRILELDALPSPHDEIAA